jgi:hypothetical protein
MDGVISTPMRFQTYTSQISKAVREKRGDRLADLLVMDGELVDQVVAGLIGSSVSTSTASGPRGHASILLGSSDLVVRSWIPARDPAVHVDVRIRRQTTVSSS